jgi:hypothetical protein
MNEYLEEVLDIDNEQVRAKIIREGYRSPDVLVKKDKAWVKLLRLAVKKSSTGNAVSRDITLEHEESLQQAAREQRREQGIPTRNVSTITTNQKKATFDETVEACHYNNDQPPASVAKNTTVQVATLEQLQPTQKPKVYKGKATKEIQMDPQAEIEILKKRLDELSERI